MNDPHFVRGVQRIDDLPGDVKHHRQREAATGGAPQPFLERLTIDQLHHERQHAVLFLEAVDRGDVWMVEGREDSRLPLEPRHALRVCHEGRWQRLQGDVPAQNHIVRPIHLPHPAGAERAVNLVRTDPAAGLEGHRLPAAFADDAERLPWFEREARTMDDMLPDDSPY